MKKNLRSMIEILPQDTPQCLVDMNQYDLIESTGCSRIWHIKRVRI